MSRDVGLPLQVTVEVRQETPFLPKVAFTLISLASLLGASFTGDHLGLSWPVAVWRWLALWALALAAGFLAWRVLYLRGQETGTDAARVDAFNATALARAGRTSQLIAGALLMGAASIPTLTYVDAAGMAVPLLGGYAVLAGLLWWGRLDPRVAGVGLALALALLGGWALADTFTTSDAALRAVHLWAFGLWVGGALWNIVVAVPAGIAHPNLDAVLAGARQLGRFRWVVRFALPTALVTGLLMADPYRANDTSWWWELPGVLIPLKLLLVVGLVVVFIVCPLYRQCSPVKGVCSVDDLRE